ncbi:MAG: type II secretion system F family protein [Desulfobacterales bacterium]|jgi:tight adherence protein B|nr:type II secretion system F family protein [Desulfobacterales bacterium]
MNQVVIGLLLFIAAISIIELIQYAYRNLDAVKRAGIRKRIKKHIFLSDPTEDVDIVKQRVLSDVPFLNRLLLAISPLRSLEKLTTQANAPYSMGFYILLSLLLGAIAFWSVSALLHNRLLAVVTAFSLAALPYVYLIILKRKRLANFQTQLPEGVDLMARALKAGHALTSAMKLVADEFEDPLSMEFDEVLREVNFGVSMTDALRNLANRVDCPEVKYFVVAVTLQRETGGNLAELLEKLADLMRRNFEFKGKVRTLTAESKFSAVILSVLPFLLALFFHVRSPEYLGFLLEHPIGRVMIGVCGGLLLIGIILVNKLAAIEV